MFALLGVRTILLEDNYEMYFCTPTTIDSIHHWFILDQLRKKSSNQNHNIITIQQKWHIKYRLHKDSRGVTSRIQLCRCCDNIGNVSTFYMLQHYDDTNKNSVWKNDIEKMKVHWLHVHSKIILTFQKRKHITKKLKNIGW